MTLSGRPYRNAADELRCLPTPGMEQAACGCLGTHDMTEVSSMQKVLHARR